MRIYKSYNYISTIKVTATIILGIVCYNENIDYNSIHFANAHYDSFTRYEK